LGAAPLPGAPSRSSTTEPRPTFVDYDRTQRILRLRAVAERVAGQLPEPDRMIFDASARGVSAYIEQHRDNLPIEFHILRYQPRAWTAADSVLVGIAMSQLLNPQYDMEYRREKISQLLTPELMADLYPLSSPRDRAPRPDKGPPVAKPPGAKTGAVTALPFAIAPGTSSLPSDGCEACVPGSNNWVVSGAHTTTGKPLLSNDMHLPHRMPAVWYELQLHSGEFDVEGFTLPGMPLVVVGHNRRIAWGFTNLNPAVQDLFVENFNATGEYETPSGWQRPETYREIIHVKGDPDSIVDVVVTRHGPIISDLLPGETRKIALQWVIYDTRRVGIPLFELDSAQNWEQFRNALSVFATPGQNVVYGDVEGNIGYQAMGFAPLRASGDGTVPVPGGDGKHDWTGYLPFDQMPS